MKQNNTGDQSKDAGCRLVMCQGLKFTFYTGANWQLDKFSVAR